MEEIKGTREKSERDEDLDLIDEWGSKPEKIETKEQELEDTKKYLEIVLKELEDVKLEMKNLKQPKRSEKKNSGKGWKLLAEAEGVLLAVLVVAGGIWYLKENFRTTQTGGNVNEPEVTPGISQKKEGKTIRLSEDLAERVAQLPELPSSFSASVEQLFGYEYLCFSNETVKVYYRNEYEEGEDLQRLGVIIDNGSRITEFDWYYDLTGKLSVLCPFLGQFTGDGSKQLLFLEGRSGAGAVKAEQEASSGTDKPIETVWKLEGKEELPGKIRLVELNYFREYASLNLLQAMEQVFDFDFMELGPGERAEAVMTLQVGEAGYNYAISQDMYTNAVYHEETELKLEEYFSMNISEDAVRVSTVVSLSETEYLGELTAKLSLQEGSLSLSEIKYGAYVLPDQEDDGSDGIIFPRTSVLGERVTILGEKKERYLIELSNQVERRTHDFENFAEDGNGFKAYYENGEKRSICGIDVSKYQGDINWNKVKEAGVEYAIIRLGFRGMNEGTLEFDPYYEQNIKGATEAGIPVGIYFFSQAVTVEEAKEEAQFVLENIKEYSITYPVIFDTEVVTTYNARANNLTRRQRTEIAKAFLEEIRTAGYEPMIYANTKWMIMGIDLEQLTEYDKWYAYYGDTITFPYEFQMLQYSDKGRVPGITGNVDLNISFVDYAK